MGWTRVTAWVSEDTCYGMGVGGHSCVRYRMIQPLGPVASSCVRARCSHLRGVGRPTRVD